MIALSALGRDRTLRGTDADLGIALLVAVNLLAARIDTNDLLAAVRVLLDTNLFVLFALFTLVHLCRIQRDRSAARAGDLAVFFATGISLIALAPIGETKDIGLVCAALAIWYGQHWQCTSSSRHLALVYCALAINLTITPIVFVLLKPFFLLGEAAFVASVWQFFGADVGHQENLLMSGSGITVQLVGACSVFSNISFAFLGFASAKAHMRQRLRRADLWLLLGLVAALIVGNALRLGMMLPSEDAYANWHHGSGATFFGIMQFAVILGITWVALFVRRAP